MNAQAKPIQERRTLIHYGYRNYAGRVLTNQEVDAYNAVQARINTFIDAGAPVPVYLLNASHNAIR